VRQQHYQKKSFNAFLIVFQGGLTSSSCPNCVTFAGCRRWVFRRRRYRCVQRSSEKRLLRPRSRQRPIPKFETNGEKLFEGARIRGSEEVEDGGIIFQ
jgi:hypothetical protein